MVALPMANLDFQIGKRYQKLLLQQIPHICLHKILFRRFLLTRAAQQKTDLHLLE